MGILEFNLSWKLIFVLITMPLAYNIRKFPQNSKGPLKAPTPFYSSLCMFIGEALCGVLDIPLSLKYKYKDNNEILTLTRTEWALFVLIPFLDFCGFFGLTIFSNVIENSMNLDTSTRLIQLLILAFLSSWILKFPFYRFQKLIIGIYTVCFLGIIVLYFCSKTAYFNALLFFSVVLGYPLCYFLYSLENIIIKWFIEYRYFTEYRILFFSGLIGIGISLLCCLPFFAFGFDNFSITMIDTEDSKQLVIAGPLNLRENLLKYSFPILMGFLINLNTQYINRIFSPCHVGIADSISGVLSTFINLLFFNESDESITITVLIIIDGVIIVIGSLIYCEVITLNAFGFSKDSTKNIIKRGDKETLKVSLENLEDKGFESDF